MYVNYYDSETKQIIYGEPVDMAPAVGGIVNHKGLPYFITYASSFAAEGNPDLWSAYIKPSELVYPDPDINPGTNIIINDGYPYVGKRAKVLRIEPDCGRNETVMLYYCRLKPEFGMTAEEILNGIVMERDWFEVITP